MLSVRWGHFKQLLSSYFITEDCHEIPGNSEFHGVQCGNRCLRASFVCKTKDLDLKFEKSGS
jgi:hypothetical protein